jgi:hypothetical protein
MPKNEFADNFPIKWRAVFKDGSFLLQFPPDGSQHRFQEIWDRKHELDFIEVLGCRHPVLISFPEGSDPIIFEKHISDDDGKNRIDRAFSYFGYKLLVGDKLQKVFVVVHHRTGLISVEFDDSRTRF